MEGLSHLGPRIIISLNDGKFFITESVIFGVILAAVIAALAIWMTNNLTAIPSKKQVVAETIVEMVYNLTKRTMGAHCVNFAPYIGTLIIFILLGNMLGLLGFRPVTADVNMTFALSTVTFFLVQFNSFRSMGFKGKIKHMCDPFPFLFPLKIIEALTQPISLGFRLFGNILGGFIVMEIIFAALEGLSHMLHLKFPLLIAVIPLPGKIFFDIFEPVVQAYIFTMLTMVFISIEIIKQGHEGH